MANEGINVIKEYLVSLGFSVDSNKYAQFQNTLNKMDALVQSKVSGMALKVAKAAGTITAAYAAVVGGTIALMINTAKADMEYQKFAARMWMAKDAAKSFKISLDAMGQSMEDIAFNPELRSQFFQLENLTKRIGTPADFENSMKNIRSMVFEFKKLRVEMTYASQWISYHLMKYLNGPLSQIRKTFAALNEKIIVGMPEWTRKVAQFLTTIINIGGHAARFIHDVFSSIKMFFDRLPGWAKAAVIGIAAAFLILQSGPVGWIMAAIGGVLLLIDDFYAYIEGRKSSKTLAPIWKTLIDITKGIKWDALSKNFGDLVSNIGEVAKGVGDVTNKVLKFFGIFDSNESKKITDFWSLVGAIVSSFFDALNGVVFLISKLLGMLGYSLQGKWQEAMKEAKDFLNFVTMQPGNTPESNNKNQGKANYGTTPGAIVPGTISNSAVNVGAINLYFPNSKIDAKDVAGQVKATINSLQGNNVSILTRQVSGGVSF